MCIFCKRFERIIHSICADFAPQSLSSPVVAPCQMLVSQNVAHASESTRRACVLLKFQLQRPSANGKVKHHQLRDPLGWGMIDINTNSIIRYQRAAFGVNMWLSCILIIWSGWGHSIERLLSIVVTDVSTTCQAVVIYFPALSSLKIHSNSNRKQQTCKTEQRKWAIV